ncbi:hypothetical protein GCM10010505_22340 [Kitasatospora aburaviensis]
MNQARVAGAKPASGSAGDWEWFCGAMPPWCRVALTSGVLPTVAGGPGVGRGWSRDRAEAVRAAGGAVRGPGGAGQSSREGRMDRQLIW